MALLANVFVVIILQHIHMYTNVHYVIHLKIPQCYVYFISIKPEKNKLGKNCFILCKYVIFPSMNIVFLIIYYFFINSLTFYGSLFVNLCHISIRLVLGILDFCFSIMNGAFFHFIFRLVITTRWEIYFKNI